MPPAPTCPWDHCCCFCSPVPPCAAGRSLLGRCLCGSFCFTGTCVGFPLPQAHPVRHGVCVQLFWLPGPALCITGRVCTCFSSQVGLCDAGLVWTCLAPHARPLCHAVYVQLFRLTANPLCHGVSVFFFWLCWEGCVLCPSLHASPVLAPWAHSAMAVFVCCITLSYPVKSSVQQELGVLAVFLFFLAAPLLSQSPPSA